VARPHPRTDLLVRPLTAVVPSPGDRPLQGLRRPPRKAVNPYLK